MEPGYTYGVLDDNKYVLAWAIAVLSWVSGLAGAYFCWQYGAKHLIPSFNQEL